MKRVDMVRCTLVDRDDGARTQHYLPQSVYEMWKYIVGSQQAFEIVDCVISAWVNEAGYSYQRGLIGEHTAEPVLELCFNAQAVADEEPKPSMRYLAAPGYERCRAFLAAVGLEDAVFANAEVTPGYFLVTHEPPVPAP